MAKKLECVGCGRPFIRGDERITFLLGENPPKLCMCRGCANTDAKTMRGRLPAMAERLRRAGIERSAGDLLAAFERAEANEFDDTGTTPSA